MGKRLARASTYDLMENLARILNKGWDSTERKMVATQIALFKIIVSIEFILQDRNKKSQ